MTSTLRIIALISAPVLLAACSSVKLPAADLVNFGEYHDDAKGVKSYPKITEAPKAPTDLRSDAAWDDAARGLQKARDSFVLPGDIPDVKPADEVRREFELARARVQEYKKDDPQ